MLFGGIYLILYMAVLPWLLPVAVFSVFPDLTGAQVNFIYFTLNFAAVTLIFREFLFQSLRDRSIQMRGGDGLQADVHHCYLVGAFTEKGENTRCHFIEHNAEGIQVALMIDLSPFRLLGANVMHRSYGKIVCRCEGITEGEILAAIRTNPKAMDLDGVKRRTRAQMGRCQGGFCSPHIVEMIAAELNIPIEKVTKSGGNSYVNVSRTKEEV